MKRQGNVILLACVLFMQNAQAVTLQQKVDSYINNLLKNKVFHGGVVLIAKGGKVLVHKAYGSADDANRKAVTTSMRFQMASITKSFTALAILQLAEQGKLALNDGLHKYIPEFPTDGEKTKITIHHLLNVSSGLAEYLDQISPTEISAQKTPQQLVDLFKDKPLRFSPGAKSEYVSSNFVLLGIIIERLTGQSYYDYVKNNILAKAGMTSSGFDFASLPASTKAKGYIRATLPVIGTGFLESPPTNTSAGYAAGSLVSTSGDMYKWFQALGSSAIVSQSSLQKMETAYLPIEAFPGTDWKYGYGAFVAPMAGGRKAVFHGGGGVPGYNTFYMNFPEDNATVILLKNMWIAELTLKTVADLLGSLVLGDSFDMTKSFKYVQPGEWQITEQLANYMFQ